MNTRSQNVVPSRESHSSYLMNFHATLHFRETPHQLVFDKFNHQLRMFITSNVISTWPKNVCQTWKGIRVCRFLLMKELKKERPRKSFVYYFNTTAMWTANAKLSRQQRRKRQKRRFYWFHTGRNLSLSTKSTFFLFVFPAASISRSRINSFFFLLIFKGEVRKKKKEGCTNHQTASQLMGFTRPTAHLCLRNPWPRSSVQPWKTFAYIHNEIKIFWKAGGVKKLIFIFHT